MATPSIGCGLLSLPPELRLQIYEYVVQPDIPTKLVFASERPTPSALSLLSLAPRTFGDVCANEWLIFTRKYPGKPLLLQYDNDGGSKSDFRLRVHRSRQLDTRLLLVNRQIYQEVLPLFWKSVELDFTQAYSALKPFANFLSPLARCQLNHVILRAPHHLSDDHVGWMNTCSYINSTLNLSGLTVEYRYRSGTNWSPEKWHRKLAVDPRTRRPSDPVVREALTFGSNTLISWDEILRFDGEDSPPHDIEFLEGLPIETEEEMRESLGIEEGRTEPLDSSLAALSKIKGLRALHLKLVSGGLTELVSQELDQYLKERMLQKESPLNLT